MSSQKKVSAIIFVFILILIASIAFYKKNRLENNFIVTNGFVYELGNSRNSGSRIFLKFKFSVNNITYYGNFGFSCKRTKRRYFQSWTNGKQVQIVYDKKNPDNCGVLLTSEDYRKYGLDIPSEYKTQVKFVDSLCNNP